MRSIHRRLFLSLSAVALIGLGGCSKLYQFDLRCVIYNAADGEPLEGVKAVVDTSGNKDDLTYGSQVSQTSDAEGRLRRKFFIPDGSPHFRAPHWYLKLEKDGFTPKVVDIKPGPEPEHADNTIPIIVVVEMRPKQPAK